MENSEKGITLAMFSRSKFEHLIPLKCLKLLPLKPEPMSGWNASDLDIVEFLKHLFNIHGEVIYPDGSKKMVNYQSYWETVFGSGLKQFQDFAREFKVEARKYEPAPASVVKKVKVPSFLDDKYFGMVAKYYIVYDGILSQVLSESYFYSIAHILESQEELACSILLAKKLYYKQSLQVLRNYIELMVSQILFCYDARAFEDWRNGVFKLPRLRGKGSLLEKLCNANLISQELSERTSSLYAALNSYIHSLERNLIHRGAYKGQYKGFIFDYDYFTIWCNSFSEAVENGILLLNSHLEQFSKTMSDGITCDICHNKDFEVKAEEEFAGQEYLKLRCKECGSEVTIKKQSGALLAY